MTGRTHPRCAPCCCSHQSLPVHLSPSQRRVMRSSGWMRSGVLGLVVASALLFAGSPALAASCPCSSPALCDPLQLGPRPEVFAFLTDTAQSEWAQFDWSQLTTIAIATDAPQVLPPELLCFAHQNSRPNNEHKRDCKRGGGSHTSRLSLRAPLMIALRVCACLLCVRQTCESCGLPTFLWVRSTILRSLRAGPLIGCPPFNPPSRTASTSTWRRFAGRHRQVTHQPRGAKKKTVPAADPPLSCCGPRSDLVAD